MKIKKILLVGGTGKLGQILCKELFKKYELIVFDKKKNNIPKNILFIKGNLLKKKDLLKLPKNIKVCIFLTGLIGGPDSVLEKNAQNYIEHNCQTLENFLNFKYNKSLKKIIFLSTEQVYNTPKTNNNNETFPKNYYGISKLIAEKICYLYYLNNRVAVYILRVPRIVSLQGNSLIHKMVLSAKNKSKIVVSHSNNYFNFLYVDDFIKAVNRVISYRAKEFRIFNIFSKSKPKSLYQIALLIKKKIKHKIKIVKLINQEDTHNPKKVYIKDKISKKILKWQPGYSIIDIITKIINYEFKR